MFTGRTGGSIRVKARGVSGFSLWLGLALSSGFPLGVKAQADPSRGGGDTIVAHLAKEVSTAPMVSGCIRGMVADVSEAAIPDARVILVAEDSGVRQDVRAAEDGSFVLVNVVPGTYALTVQRDGFEAWHGAAKLGSGEQMTLPGIALMASAVSASVEVRASTREIAEAQLGLEEKQRVLGVFPNFYASYAPNAEPLSSRQKFQLAWRFVNDPVALAIAGVTAGSEQRADTFHNYGGGATGYSKRYSAAYADGFTSTFLGQALLPAVFHQDPRYFVKGTGSVASRALYAMASMVICKGDNRRWQPNYSNVLGNFASASLSNVYYPSSSRGGELIVGNAMMATAMGAVGGLFQEFVLHRMTPHVPDYESVR